MSRASQKLLLQRDLTEAQKRKQQSPKHASSISQSSAIRLPDTSSVFSSSVPGEVFQVQTSLQHPTRYHVQQKQRDQVANYLSQSAGNTKVVLHKLLQPHQSNLTGPSSAPGGPGASAPASPLARLNLSTSADQDYDIIDDIVQLENLANNTQYSTTLPTIDGNALTVFNANPAANLSVFDQNKTSSSCPPEIVPKQEYLEGEGVVGFMQDRVKKDNHNRIERRRRYNINDRIKELGTLIPRSSDPDMRWNKGSILKAAVDHMRDLQGKMSLAQQIEKSHHDMKVANKRLLLRIQELEICIKSNGMEVPPMQDQQEMVEIILQPDQHMFGTGEFSKEEEFQVAAFPSQPVPNNLLNPVLKQERISPSPLSLQPHQDQQASPANYQNQSLDQMQMQTTSENMQLQYNQGQSGLLLSSAQDHPGMPDPYAVTYGDNSQSFNSLLNQQDLNFDDVMMDEDMTPIRTDIFLSDSIHQS